MTLKSRRRWRRWQLARAKEDPSQDGQWDGDGDKDGAEMGLHHS